MAKKNSKWTVLRTNKNYDLLYVHAAEGVFDTQEEAQEYASKMEAKEAKRHTQYEVDLKAHQVYVRESKKLFKKKLGVPEHYSLEAMFLTPENGYHDVVPETATAKDSLSWYEGLGSWRRSGIKKKYFKLMAKLKEAAPPYHFEMYEFVVRPLEMKTAA